MRLLRRASVLGAALALIGVRVWRHCQSAIEGVPPELRHPLLPLATVPLNSRTLRLSRRITAIKTPAGEGVSVSEHVIPGGSPLRVLVTIPADRDGASPGVISIHGGGYVAGSPELEQVLNSTYARELGAVVVSPDYRLSPEDPFPAALDDCMRALKWMLEEGEALGVDIDRVAIAGTSAGGGLAAALAQRATDELISLRAQALASPMLDDRTTLLEDHKGRGRLIWTPKANMFGWTAYLGRRPVADAAPEYSVPARRRDLGGLPPAWIGVGELDLFHDEAVAYAHHLESDGTSCALTVIPGLYHGAEGMVPGARAVREMRASMLGHLAEHLR